MEVKSISKPSGESNNEEEPIFTAQLRKQADGVLEGGWCLPDIGTFAVLICDFDSLFPFEQVAKGLFCCRESAFCNGLSGLKVGRSS